MNWLRKIAVHVVVVVTSHDGSMKVFINGKPYWFRGEIRDHRIVQMYCDRGWHGKAVQYLNNHMELLEGPNENDIGK